MRSTVSAAANRTEAPFALDMPPRVNCPLVFASPHSGTDYPPAFIAESSLEPLLLRRSEDSFVDELFGAAPANGAPLLRALFPRAYCDANREPYELDQGMFEDRLPPETNTASPRVAGGLGTIAKVVANGAEIYRRKLRYVEAELRIERLYKPYHAALAQAIETARRQFGLAILIDCHSMPSVGGPTDRDEGRNRPDMVLGDRFGASCHAAVTELVEAALSRFGYQVARNHPYAGGYTTLHYGQPRRQVHALQIEINRALYMDEENIRPNAGFKRIQADITRLIEVLVTADFVDLKSS